MPHCQGRAACLPTHLLVSRGVAAMPDLAEGGSGGRPWRALFPGLGVRAPGLDAVAGTGPRLRRGTARPRPPMPAGSGSVGEDAALPAPPSPADPPREGSRSSGTPRLIPAGCCWRCCCCCSGSCTVGRRSDMTGEADPDSQPEARVEELEVRRCSSPLPPPLLRRCMRPRAGWRASNSRLSSLTKKSTTAAAWKGRQTFESVVDLQLVWLVKIAG
jgi:hypothetical protein